ncbi:hypothetical protein DFH08DRAFT_799668 [Mycena albidolilacea]|uniref:Uncharacterized protein n=1 Tax=Mycena albidolilacea TaxID=1033008 RepID=A0AAD7AM75_9AGAR|nr:hypothetical protein DFH08DRAFT_799668 [Mycena albidolilacea]
MSPAPTATQIRLNSISTCLTAATNTVKILAETLKTPFLDFAAAVPLPHAAAAVAALQRQSAVVIFTADIELLGIAIISGFAGVGALYLLPTTWPTGNSFFSLDGERRVRIGERKTANEEWWSGDRERRGMGRGEEGKESVLGTRRCVIGRNHEQVGKERWTMCCGEGGKAHLQKKEGRRADRLGVAVAWRQDLMRGQRKATPWGQDETRARSRGSGEAGRDGTGVAEWMRARAQGRVMRTQSLGGSGLAWKGGVEQHSGQAHGGAGGRSGQEG